MKFGKGIIGCLVVTMSPVAVAAPWVVKSGDADVNWSTLAIQFAGVANSAPSDREGLKGLERTAWRNGYDRAGSVLEPLLKDQFARAAGQNGQPEQGLVSGAVEEVRKSVKSLNATFYSNGSVEVAMEASLRAGFTAALRLAGAGGKPLSGGNPESSSTGLLIKVPSSAQPSAAFWLVEASGKVLFEPAMLSKEGVAQGSMGRWYRTPGKEELTVITGEKPETLIVSEVRQGNRFVVDSQQFAALGAGALRALSDGKAVVAGR